MDEIEMRLASTELLLELVISVLAADQLDELRRRLDEVAGLADDGRAILASARQMIDVGRQATAAPATMSATAAALLARTLGRL